MINGERLKKLRTDRRLTQDALGQLIEVSKVSVCYYESGIRTPTLETLLKICEVLETNVNYLIGMDICLPVKGTLRKYNITLSEEEYKVLEQLRLYPNLFKNLSNNIDKVNVLLEK